MNNNRSIGDASSTSSTARNGAGIGVNGRRTLPKAYTGTPSRMNVLPDPVITSVDHHLNTTVESMDHGNTNTVSYDDMYQCGSQEVYRKCVYTYEDKYIFSRIIVADSLVFDSHFESGNLHSAFRLNPADDSSFCNKHFYDLYMHNDLNTNGFTQWFYFSVSNTRRGQEATFYIKNFVKSDSLFNIGMRPLMYSTKLQGCKGGGWRRCGTNVAYIANSSTDSNIVGGDKGLQEDKQSSKKKGSTVPYYTLAFTHIFESTDDVCYFAFSHPYTYSDLQRYLLKAENDPFISKYMRRTLLCKTIGGNLCDLLTITSPCASAEELLRRTVVIFTARVHPGETNSSWIMQGILSFLLSDNEQAEMLRRMYVFKIVPMLNPDGVINGNYRTGLAGVDLNRNWINPDVSKHPTIYHTKEMISRLARLRTISLLVDIHGHSTKEGIFFYSCIPEKKYAKYIAPKSEVSTGSSTDALTTENMDDINDPLSKLGGSSYNASFDTSSHDGVKNRDNYVVTNQATGKKCALHDVIDWKARLLPRILQCLSPVFSYKSCSFKMQKSKDSTMRIVAFTELGIDNAYTLEASLGGCRPYHFGVNDLLSFGSDVCIGLLTCMSAFSIQPVDMQLGRRIATAASDYIDALNSQSNFGEGDSTELSVILEEIPSWRPYYSNEDRGVGASLISTLYATDVLEASTDVSHGTETTPIIPNTKKVKNRRPSSSGQYLSKKLVCKSAVPATANEFPAFCCKDYVNPTADVDSDIARRVASATSSFKATKHTQTSTSSKHIAAASPTVNTSNIVFDESLPMKPVKAKSRLREKFNSMHLNKMMLNLDNTPAAANVMNNKNLGKGKMLVRASTAVQYKSDSSKRIVSSSCDQDTQEVYTQRQIVKLALEVEHSRPPSIHPKVSKYSGTHRADRVKIPTSSA